MAFILLFKFKLKCLFRPRSQSNYYTEARSFLLRKKSEYSEHKHSLSEEKVWNEWTNEKKNNTDNGNG